MTHHHNGLPANYDIWRLASPYDEYSDATGVEEGELCNRIQEPDEDAPRNHRPKPCNGVMIFDAEVDGLGCDNCGEVVYE